MTDKTFYDLLRQNVTHGSITPGQLDGIMRIKAEFEARQLTDIRWLANILAQSYWESDRTWQPCLEKGSRSYLKSKRYWPYIGAGLIQVTWKSNYTKFGAEKPEDLLTWPIALRALFDGMIKGMFTGRKLSDYFNDHKNDPVGARAIVNGKDHAIQIAHIHDDILDALKKL